MVATIFEKSFIQQRIDERPRVHADINIYDTPIIVFKYSTDSKVKE